MPDARPGEQRDTTPEAPDRIATDLLRIARHPISGRVRGGGTLDIALRGGLLCDLILEGRVGNDGRAPFVYEDAASDTGDHILDTLAGTVERRPNVAWWRWYRHVRVDRVALIKELVDTGVWTSTGGVGPLAAYEDVEPKYGTALNATLDGVLHARDAGDLRRVCSAILKYMAGADGSLSHPRALRRDLKDYIAQVRSGGQMGEAAVAAIAGSSVLMRRRFRR